MMGTPMGFRMQTPDAGGTAAGASAKIVDMQPPGQNLPMMKPDDMQYFDKLLVSLYDMSN